MSNICTRIQHETLMNIDWGEALTNYIALNTSQDHADWLSAQGRIGYALADGKLNARELLWKSYFGLGLSDSQHWLNLGGSAQTLLDGIASSGEELRKQQFMNGLKRWCTQDTETTAK